MRELPNFRAANYQQLSDPAINSLQAHSKKEVYLGDRFLETGRACLMNTSLCRDQ